MAVANPQDVNQQPLQNLSPKKHLLGRFPALISVRKLLPGRYWLISFIVVLVKVLIFQGLVTRNGEALGFLKHFFDLSVYIAIAFTLAYFSIALLFKGRNRVKAVFILNLLLTSLLLADLMYFRGYGSFLTPYLLKQTSNLDNLWAAIFSMLRGYDIFFVLDLLISAAALFRFRTFGRKLERRGLLFVVFFLLSTGVIYGAHRYFDVIDHGKHRLVFWVTWNATDTMANLSPIGYHLYDTALYFEENRPVELTPKDQNTINQWFAAKQEHLPDNSYKGLFAGKNVILLQVESLENFVINQSYQNQEITPTLNRLLKNSLYFPNFHEQVWNGTTSDAELMANTSVYPVRKGSTFFRFPQNRYNSLPVLLGNQGYFTQAIHPDKGSYWNWRQALTSFGFDRTYDASSFQQEEQIGLGLSDGSFLRQVAPILKETKQPFYTFMITLTSHGPFDLPSKYRELKMDPALDQTKLGGYFQSVHYTDEQIGNFLDRLDQEGLLNNTVVVIYGDHGGVHKYYNDELAKIPNPEGWWSNYDRKVPFIIYSKGMMPHIVPTTGGEIDILPTVSYLMGVDPTQYASTALGRNLLNTQKDFAVLADGTFEGKDTDPEEKKEAVQGIDISDLIVQSDYFGRMGLGK